NLRMYFRKWVIHPIRRKKTHLRSRLLQHKGCKIVGVAGSAGKTTTKQMLHSVLSQKFKTVSSKGNIDPVYNIPETVLHTPLDTEMLVLEMSVEFPGEMNFYNWLANPDIGVLISVDWTHTEFFGDVEGVLREEEKIATLLSENSFAVLNYDDKRVRSVASKTKAKVLFFGSCNKCDVWFSDVFITKDLKTQVTLHHKNDRVKVLVPFLGYHFASLAAAAACVGLINNMDLLDIKIGIEESRGEPHRMLPILLRDNITIIDDTYNANPLATKAALKVLKDVAGKRRKIFVFGEMKELGAHAIKGHEDVGEYVAEVGVDELITIGALTKETIKSASKNANRKMNAVNLESNQEVVKELLKRLQPNDVVLIKGSRSMKLDEVVDTIQRFYKKAGAYNLKSVKN
ncbi:MAG: UDP-N-acetylmuramoyl-tripeptide--D-alanyl-D-alanine ligase, partial [Patescibacteria group bacterium]|nr:UDP-N-acetylmuramoyl-tripeptide--D-alanyl-D-alanine ligase [Patescibacteria group bacterium]